VWQPDARNADPAGVTDATSRTAALGAFAGLEGWGEWVLFLADMESGGTNLLVSWQLEITGQSRPIITWADPAAITYGSPLGVAQLNALANVPGTLAYTPASGTVLNAGNDQPLSVTFTPQDAVSYATVVTNVSIDVLRAALTITAANKAKVFGQSLPSLTANYTGFVNSDTPASLDSPAVLNTTATAGSAVGTYPITVSGAADANYVITPVNGLLTVNKASSSGAVSVSANPVPTGAPVTLTMTLGAVAPGAGTPTGTVQFLVDGNPFGIPAALAGHRAVFGGWKSIRKPRRPGGGSGGPDDVLPRAGKPHGRCGLCRQRQLHGCLRLTARAAGHQHPACRRRGPHRTVPRSGRQGARHNVARKRHRRGWRPACAGERQRRKR
jgi:hypothetical protein